MALVAQVVPIYAVSHLFEALAVSTKLNSPKHLHGLRKLFLLMMMHFTWEGRLEWSRGAAVDREQQGRFCKVSSQSLVQV